jgi:hypothetical protein
VTILMMGAGSLLMAVLPTYAGAGLLAPALLRLPETAHRPLDRGRTAPVTVER